ncbi:uncharacterized protein LOC131327688 [Rhododendron vialii]|uniref:uncharacterized protein LOC131327688 n=1 Tax=Rhododendron vialii TaxID=182163 RepID=UPI00265E834C|nr:uncharacterized protein LOC131327688 [Rhododendron vialii]
MNKAPDPLSGGGAVLLAMAAAAVWGWGRVPPPGGRRWWGSGVKNKGFESKMILEGGHFCLQNHVLLSRTTISLSLSQTNAYGREPNGYGSNIQTRNGLPVHPHTDIEKRQLFVLRSYQFCRKKSFTERIKGSVFRVKRVIWIRLRSAVKFRKMLWFRLRNGGLFCGTRKKRFIRLYNATNTASKSFFW